MQNALQFGMIYLITALYDEAKPLLEHWSFKRDRSLPYRLYRNETLCLLVTQMGMENAAKAIQALMQFTPAQRGDILINVGLCAAPRTYPLGTALYTGSIQHREKSVQLHKTYDIALPTTMLLSVDTPVSTPQACAVDM